MSKVFYYSLHTISPTPGYPQKDWLEEYRKTRCCPECNLPKPGAGPIDVYLEYKPDRAVLNFAGPALVGIARSDFLEVLGMDTVLKYLDLGSVFVESQAVPGYVTFHGRKLLRLYGKKSLSAEKYCGICGQWRGSLRGARYLLANDLTGAPIYESSIHQLVVDEETYGKVSQRKWTHLGHQRLPVMPA
jgi:hypothetical protein